MSVTRFSSSLPRLRRRRRQNKIKSPGKQFAGEKALRGLSFKGAANVTCRYKIPFWSPLYSVPMKRNEVAARLDVFLADFHLKKRAGGYRPLWKRRSGKQKIEWSASTQWIRSNANEGTWKATFFLSKLRDNVNSICMISKLRSRGKIRRRWYSGQQWKAHAFLSNTRRGFF